MRELTPERGVYSAAVPQDAAHGTEGESGALCDAGETRDPHALLAVREEGRRGGRGGETDAALTAEGSPQVSPARLGSIQ
jgi:hypothetical protein